MHSIVTLQYANGHRLIIFRQHVWYLCSGIHLKQVLLPIYILKASFVPIYCQRRMASLFSLHIKKKMPRVGLAGPQEGEESMEKREKVVRQTLGGRWVGAFIPFK